MSRECTQFSGASGNQGFAMTREDHAYVISVITVISEYNGEN